MDSATLKGRLFQYENRIYEVDVNKIVDIILNHVFDNYLYELLKKLISFDTYPISSTNLSTLVVTEETSKIKFKDILSNSHFFTFEIACISISSNFGLILKSALFEPTITELVPRDTKRKREEPEFDYIGIVSYKVNDVVKTKKTKSFRFKTEKDAEESLTVFREVCEKYSSFLFTAIVKTEKITPFTLTAIADTIKDIN
jgi:hypothetical protein